MLFRREATTEPGPCTIPAVARTPGLQVQDDAHLEEPGSDPMFFIHPAAAGVGEGTSGQLQGFEGCHI